MCHISYLNQPTTSKILQTKRYKSLQRSPFLVFCYWKSMPQTMTRWPEDFLCLAFEVKIARAVLFKALSKPVACHFVRPVWGILLLKFNYTTFYQVVLLDPVRTFTFGFLLLAYTTLSSLPQEFRHLHRALGEHLEQYWKDSQIESKIVISLSSFFRLICSP